MRFRRNRILRECAFTVIELITAMGVSAIFFFVASPRLGDLLMSFDKRNAEMLFIEDIRLAQAISVEQGCQGVMTISEDGTRYSFGCDYIPYSEESPPVMDTQSFARNLPSGVQISADGLIMFNSRGQAIDENGALNTRLITLSVTRSGEASAFNTGTLRATGFFTYAG